jgi:membrane dipeptidase
VDLHADTPFQTFFRLVPLADTELGANPKYDGVVLSIHLPEGLRPGPANTEHFLELLAEATALQAEIPTSTWLSFEGRPPDISTLLGSGVVIFGLVHFWDNDLASAATDPRPATRGLTALGESLVRQIYEAGAVVDVSHLGDDAFDAVASVASAYQMPLIATHSGARAVVSSPRNLSDDQLRTIARSGGLVGVTLHGTHLSGGAATSRDWGAHVGHMIGIMGSEHVALGSDFDAMAKLPSDVQTAADTPALADALAARGYSDALIEQVLRANALTFLRSLPIRPAE